jgi:hypothetical protein
LVPLPTYSPHLNLIERLWHYMRDNMTRSYFHGTFVELSVVEKIEALVHNVPMGAFIGWGSPPTQIIPRIFR